MIYLQLRLTLYFHYRLQGLCVHIEFNHHLYKFSRSFLLSNLFSKLFYHWSGGCFVSLDLGIHLVILVTIITLFLKNVNMNIP